MKGSDFKASDLKTGLSIIGFFTVCSWVFSWINTILEIFFGPFWWENLTFYLIVIIVGGWLIWLVLYLIIDALKAKFYKALIPKMITLPRGGFVMGAPQDEVGRNENEGPEHMIQIDYELSVGMYPVTFAEYDSYLACEDPKPSFYKRPRSFSTGAGKSFKEWGRGERPVIGVSWDDTQLYLEWLSKVTGKTYRLLSEAEWEYAARAGSQTAYSFGNDPKELDRYAWFRKNSRGILNPVGEKLPNAFGLYDMHGNIFELTQDCWNENYSGAPTDGSAWTTGDCSQRVARGGAWNSDPQNLRSASRHNVISAGWSQYTGFRVARTD
jgi:formylglycine-generating enzyme required for sulfatase activity